MKKLVLTVSVGACAIALALAGCSSAATSSASSVSSASSSSASSAASASADSSASGLVGVPNPWSDVSSARDAAAGAGIEGFSIPEGATISLGKVEPSGYRCMEGLAEADVPIAAVEMTIRKGRSSVGAESGDVSGDYNEYAYRWTHPVDDFEVMCYGNREGEATKTLWTKGDYSFSITAYGAGGDDDFGLNADDLDVLVRGTM